MIAHAHLSRGIVTDRLHGRNGQRQIITAPPFVKPALAVIVRLKVDDGPAFAINGAARLGIVKLKEQMDAPLRPQAERLHKMIVPGRWAHRHDPRRIPRTTELFAPIPQLPALAFFAVGQVQRPICADRQGGIGIRRTQRFRFTPALGRSGIIGVAIVKIAGMGANDGMHTAAGIKRQRRPTMIVYAAAQLERRL